MHLSTASIANFPACDGAKAFQLEISPFLDCLVETTQWYMLEGKELSQGIYRSKFDNVIISGEEVVRRGDKVRVVEGYALPIDSVLGIDIYEGIHINSGQPMYFSTGEIEK